MTGDSVRTRRFGGVGTALVTPLARDGALDTDTLRKLLSRILSGGVDFIVCGGTSGGGPFVEERTRIDMIATAAEHVHGRVPVVAGLIADSLEAAKRQIRLLCELNIDGLMVTPPYYYPLSSGSMVRFYEEVANASAAPIILYNIPQNARTPINTEILSALMDLPNIVAIKDSGARDFAAHADLIDMAKDREDFSILTGVDRLLLPSLVMGGHGVISPSGNVWPQGAVAVLEEFERGDLAAARQAQRDLAVVLAAVRVGQFPGWWNAATPETASLGAVVAELIDQSTVDERRSIGGALRAASDARERKD